MSSDKYHHVSETYSHRGFLHGSVGTFVAATTSGHIAAAVQVIVTFSSCQQSE